MPVKCNTLRVMLKMIKQYLKSDPFSVTFHCQQGVSTGYRLIHCLLPEKQSLNHISYSQRCFSGELAHLRKNAALV